MKLQDIIEINKEMDINALPIEGRGISLTWRQMYSLIREYQSNEFVEGFQYRENERCLNAIAAGNYEIAAEVAPKTIYGINLVIGNNKCSEGRA